MKIALPSRQNHIDNHFGHCEYYTIFTVDKSNNSIISQETLASPEGCGCKSNIAQTLAELGVKLMLAGNMGEGAVNVLQRAGIEVIRGCAGDVNEVVSHWLQGTLKDSGESCHAHDHEHNCNH